MSCRFAPDAVTSKLVLDNEVRSVPLFGSVARPLMREVPCCQPHRHVGIEVLHERKDTELAL